jgi:uncharacterized protein with PQ loop repeat
MGTSGGDRGGTALLGKEEEISIDDVWVISVTLRRIAAANWHPGRAGNKRSCATPWHGNCCARGDGHGKYGALASVRRVTGVSLIGWLSSLVLLLTLCQQIRVQWCSRESRGVSRWLFGGQLAASSGFAVYSYLLHNPVFLATNLLLVANAAVGQWVTLRNRHTATSCAQRVSRGTQTARHPG